MMAMTTSSSIKVKLEAADQAPFRLALRKRPDLFIVNLCQVVRPADAIGFCAEPVANTSRSFSSRPAFASKNRQREKRGAHPRVLGGAPVSKPA
jgi:hypothetical protein